MLFKISNLIFYTQKVAYLCLRIPVLQSKQEIFNPLNPYLFTLYCRQNPFKIWPNSLHRRPSRCTPAQHTTNGEQEHPRPFFNRLKNLSRSPKPLRVDPTNLRCILDQHTLSLIKARFTERERAGVNQLSGVNGPLVRTRQIIRCRVTANLQSKALAYMGWGYKITSTSYNFEKKILWGTYDSSFGKVFFISNAYKILKRLNFDKRPVL